MSWHFASRPKWLVRHVAVGILVATMVVLGFWQLRRLDEKQAYKALVEARQEEPAAEVRDVIPPGAGVRDETVAGILYRDVTATGTYDDAETVVVENRTFNSASGAWVLTPLRLDDGTAVVVNRGFVGFDREGAIVPPPAPDGDVTVEGLVFPSQQRGRIGPRDPAEGQLSVLARVDLERFADQLDYDVLPAYVQLVDSEPSERPAAEGAPGLVSLGPPEPDEGPHLAYAAQWFIFTAIAAGGYLLLLRRVARDRATEQRADAADVALGRELADLLDREARQ
ncbi:MAG: SURF1 family protein [Acidimicrobiales bacterium]